MAAINHTIQVSIHQVSARRMEIRIGDQVSVLDFPAGYEVREVPLPFWLRAWAWLRLRVWRARVAMGAPRA